MRVRAICKVVEVVLVVALSIVVVVSFVESLKSLPAPFLLLSVPLSAATLASHETPEITEFPVYFGQSPFDQFTAFCAEHGTLQDSVDKISVLLSAMESLKNSYDAHVAIHYTVPSSVPNSQPVVQTFNADRSMSFELAISNVCTSLLLPSAECLPLAMRFLVNSWPFVEKAIRFAYLDSLYPKSQEIVEDSDILFLVNIEFSSTNFGGPGLGNVLKALVTFESIHTNTMLQNRQNYKLGKYASILEDYRVRMEDTHDSRANVELVYTHRLLVLRSEERVAPRRLQYQRLEHINNMDLLPYFSKNVSVDHIFDRFAIPRSMLKRILGGFHRIPFRKHVVQTATEISNKCPNPCLVVAVRSGKGAHEKKNIAQKMSNGILLYELNNEALLSIVDLYIRCITDVLKWHPLIQGIIMLYDDSSLMNSFHSKLNSLGKNIPYFYHEFSDETDPLVAAAVDLLVLSSGSVLLGKRTSTFLEVAHWLGDLRKPVYFVPDEPPMDHVAAEWAVPVTNRSIDRIHQCLSRCYQQFRATSRQGFAEYQRCEENCDSDDLPLSTKASWLEDYRPNPYAAKFLSVPSEDVYYFDGRNASQSCSRLRLEISNHVPVLDILHPVSDVTPSTSASMSLSKPRILCVVFTTDSKHGSELPAVVETWGRQCGGFLAFSNASDISIPTSNIEQEGPDTYDNLWRKLVAICKYINSEYLEEFDWFLLADDDTFVVVDNLEDYLSSDEVKRSQEIKLPLRAPTGVYLGRRLKIWDFRKNVSTSASDPLNTYNSGGSGIVLDRAALSRLVQAFEAKGDPCGSRVAYLFNDVPLAKCFYRLGIVASDTRDSDGRERFHHFSPSEEVIGPQKGSWWDVHYVGRQRGLASLSSTSISFHRIKMAWEMRAIHSYTMNCRKNKHM